MTTLVVTNDFPPRGGGIQTFVRALVGQFQPDQIVVFSSTSPGSDDYDDQQPFQIVRHPTSMLLPTPGVRRAVVDQVRRVGADQVWFGAAAPLGLLAPALRSSGVRTLVGSTHGHETGWAAAPVARQLLRRIASGLDSLTYITEFTRSKLQSVVGSVTDLQRVSPGVDVERFHPGVDATAVRRTNRLEGHLVIGCVSRLVPRKGQDVLIAAMPLIRAQVPSAVLFIVGHGRDIARLQALVQRHGVEDCVRFSGAVSGEELPAHYAASDVFAMPCRTRRAGLDVEGLGMVYLEAAATGIAVVAGNSGGAPEAIDDGVTGLVVSDPRSAAAVAEPLVRLLLDTAERDRMGIAGRAWVEQHWTWQAQADRLKSLLQLP